MKNGFRIHVLFLGVFAMLIGLYVMHSNISVQPKPVHADVVSPTPTVTPTDTPTQQKSLTFRTSASAQGIFSDGVALTLPANIQAGDLLIAVAGTNGPKTTWYTPVGWNYGAGSTIRATQGLIWWWKVADGTEAGKTITFKSAKWEDGGMVVNVYQGESADNPIAGVSSITTTDNDGVGNVTSAPIAGVSLATSVNAVPLLFASWQETPTTFTWPNGFGFESTATDGFASVAVAESLYSNTLSTFPGYTLSLSPAQAIVQTLQVLVRVQ